jgi:hypothetical protein
MNNKIKIVNKGDNMKIVMILMALMVLFTGCGRDRHNDQDSDQGAQGVPGPQGPAGAVSPASDAVQTIADAYSAYRVSIGQDPISQGLTCLLYTVPTTIAAILATLTSGFSTSGWTSIGSWTYFGTFNQADVPGTNGFEVLPTQLQPFYATYFVVHCTGYVVISSSGFHSFTTSSDDGSNLYVDGGLPLVAIDGVHAIQTVTGVKNLQANVHSFELDYLQGPGNVALTVNMDGVLLPAENLWH